MSKAHKPFARLLRVSTTRIDGGSLFGSTPKERWERFVSTDRQNRVAVGNYSVLIDHPSGWVLVNAGPGDKAPLSLDVAPMRSRSSMLRELRELGLMPKDISVVIYTHLHDEHVGGGTHMTSSGRTLPTFPHARYIVQRAALDEASQTNERTARRYRADDVEPLVDSGQLELIDGSMEVVEGVFVEPAPGPTAGHQIVIAQNHRGTYAFLGLLLPTPMHPIRNHAPMRGGPLQMDRFPVIGEITLNLKVPGAMRADQGTWNQECALMNARHNIFKCIDSSSSKR